MAERTTQPGRDKLRFLSKALRIYRSGKRTLFAGTRLRYRRFWEFFTLPRYFRILRANPECTRSSSGLALDLLIWYFSHKTLPTHYGKYRLWEVGREDWKYYYASNYRPHQDARLSKAVQPLEYRILFDDKYVCALLCQALGFRIPRTYGVLDPRRDYRRQLQVWLEASDARRLIIKPLCGRSGRDIVIAEQVGGANLIRSGRGATPLDRYVLRQKAIVQEVMSQHAKMAAYSSASVNTLRIVTLVTPQNEILIVHAALRTGVGPAFIDNWSAGGVAAGIDVEKGRLMKYAFDKTGKRYLAHPTSGLAFEGYPVPEWDRLRDTAISIQKAFPFYKMLGPDLALDTTGEPVLLEINYAPDLTFGEQTGGPLFKNEAVLRAFGEYDLLVNKHQKRLYAGLGAR